MTNSPRTQNPFDILLVVKPVGAHGAHGDLAKASEQGPGHLGGRISEELWKHFLYIPCVPCIYIIYIYIPCLYIYRDSIIYR